MIVREGMWARRSFWGGPTCLIMGHGPHTDALLHDETLPRSTAAPQYDGAHAMDDCQHARDGDEPCVPIVAEEGGSGEQHHADGKGSHG